MPIRPQRGRVRRFFITFFACAKKVTQESTPREPMVPPGPFLSAAARGRRHWLTGGACPPPYRSPPALLGQEYSRAPFLSASAPVTVAVWSAWANLRQKGVAALYKTKNRISRLSSGNASLTLNSAFCTLHFATCSNGEDALCKGAVEAF